ncbi:MAG: hypothetical protein Q9170_001529 [Blastenia crenularia]
MQLSIEVLSDPMKGFQFHRLPKQIVQYTKRPAPKAIIRRAYMASKVEPSTVVSQKLATGGQNRSPAKKIKIDEKRLALLCLILLSLFDMGVITVAYIIKPGFRDMAIRDVINALAETKLLKVLICCALAVPIQMLVFTCFTMKLTVAGQKRPGLLIPWLAKVDEHRAATPRRKAGKEVVDDNTRILKIKQQIKALPEESKSKLFEELRPQVERRSFLEARHSMYL